MKVASSVLSVKKKAAPVFALFFFIGLPAIGFSQPAGPGGGDGGNPDGVPFDSNMNLVFLVLSILFALGIILNEYRERKAIS